MWKAIIVIVIVVIVGVIVWQVNNGWKHVKGLYELVSDWLSEDQRKLIDKLKEDLKKNDSMIIELKNELNRVNNEKRKIEEKLKVSTEEVTKLKRRINDLEKTLENVLVSNNVDELLDELKQMGFSSVDRKQQQNRNSHR